MASVKQRQAIIAAASGEYDVLALGGARGGTKTRTSCTINVDRALQFPHSEHIMLRRVLKAADLNLGKEIEKVLRWKGLPLGKLNRGEIQYFTKDHIYRFPNGAFIELGFCLKEDDWEQFQGREAMTITFEEANQFPEEAFDKVGGSNRTYHEGEIYGRGLRLLTFNPGGRGHGWTYRRIFDPKTRDRRTFFIPMKLRESKPTLENDPGYALRVLRPLPEWLRRQWEEGDMEAVEGAFWSLDPAMFQKVEVPDYAEYFAGVDAGYFPCAFAVVWIAKWRDEKGRLRIHVVKAIKRHRLTLSEQADAALAVEKTLKIRPKRRHADPMAWKRIESEDRSTATTAYIWHKNGLLVLPAIRTPRSEGWQVLRTYMADVDPLSGYRCFTIDPDCYALKAEMVSAVHDRNSDDMVDGAEDDVQDSLRYVVISEVYGDGGRKKDAEAIKRFRGGRHKGKARPNETFVTTNR